MDKVNVGDPLKIPAQTFNAFIDAARYVQKRQTGAAAQQPKASGEIIIKNMTGQDVGLYDVVGLGTNVYDPDDEDHLPKIASEIILEGELPDPELHAGKWALCLERIPDGKAGRALVSGVSPARITLANVDHEFVDVQADEVQLKSCAAGSGRILWVQDYDGSGSGEIDEPNLWAVIMFPAYDAPMLYQATADEADGEITIKKLTSAGETTGEEITVSTLTEGS